MNKYFGVLSALLAGLMTVNLGTVAFANDTVIEIDSYRHTVDVFFNKAQCLSSIRNDDMTEQKEAQP